MSSSHTHLYTHMYTHICAHLKVICTHIHTDALKPHAFEKDFASVLICPLSHCFSCFCFYMLPYFCIFFFVENKSIGNAAIAKLSQRLKACVRSAIRLALMVFLSASTNIRTPTHTYTQLACAKTLAHIYTVLIYAYI